MRIKMIVVLAACCGLLATIPAQAQRRPAVPRIEELPRLPLDTLPTDDPETRIVLYTNNTWAYHRPAMQLYDELPVYSEYWDTTQIFSYKSVELAELPERIDLALINSAEEYHVPITGAVRSPYGVRRRRNHNGIDIPLRTGDPIYATFEGRVRYSKYNTGGYGNLVILRHKNGLETWYGHLSRSNVTENQYVKAGEVIGYGGNTGRSTGPHLHYEVRYYDQSFDPQHLIAFPDGGLKTEVFALEKSFFNIHSRASEELIEDEVDDEMWDSELQLLAEMGDTTASRQLLANAVAREQEAERRRQEAARAVYHTIASGDVLGTIARRYGVSIDQICRLNSITRSTVLRLGRQLRVK